MENYLSSHKRNFMVASLNNEPASVCFASKSEVPYRCFLCSQAHGDIFPCVNRLCERLPALMGGLLSSTLSHAQVCSTIVDRISSGLPFFPYHQHFSVQLLFNWHTDFAYKTCCKITSYFRFHVLSYSPYRPLCHSSQKLPLQLIL